MIELNYSLNKEDYLNFQLFAATKNPVIKKQRLISRFLILLILALIGFLFLNTNTLIACYFFLAAVAFFLIYPLYSKWFYKRHFKKHVDQFFDPGVGVISVGFDDENMYLADKKSNSSVKLRELLGITEIANYFLIQVTKANYVIIPRREVEDIEKLRDYLQKCSKKVDIPYSVELNWKWK